MTDTGKVPQRTHMAVWQNTELETIALSLDPTDITGLNVLFA